MKKKLIKELNKLLPNNWKVDKYILNGGDEFGDDIFNLKIYAKQQPTKEQLLEKAKRDYPEGTIIYDFKNKKEFTVKKVDVYNVTDTKKWGICGQNNLCVIYYKGKWSKIIKKPIFKLNNKFMYEGDEFYFVDGNDNWKLKERVVKETMTNAMNIFSTFTTKQEALNYVLEEAKERFKDAFITKDGRIAKGKFVGSEVWNEKYGWIAEPIKEPSEWIKFDQDYGNAFKNTPYKVKRWEGDIPWIIDEDKEITEVTVSYKPANLPKEPKLMLGNEVVEIEPVYEDSEVNEIIGTAIINCKGESVTKEEWMGWYYSINKIVEKEGTFCLFLSKYKTDNLNHTSTFKIGCIENISWGQIESITKALNELGGVMPHYFYKQKDGSFTDYWVCAIDTPRTDPEADCDGIACECYDENIAKIIVDALNGA